MNSTNKSFYSSKKGDIKSIAELDSFKDLNKDSKI